MISVLALLMLSGWPEVAVEASYDGPAGLEDKCTGMVGASGGEVYLSGYSMGEETDFDFATVRFSAAGSTGWVRRYGAPLGNEDRSWMIARDSGGGIIVAGGSVEDFAHGWDFVLIRYRPDGFEDDDDPCAGFLHPLLQRDQLRVQPVKLSLVLFSAQLLGTRVLLAHAAPDIRVGPVRPNTRSVVGLAAVAAAAMKASATGTSSLRVQIHPAASTPFEP